MPGIEDFLDMARRSSRDSRTPDGYDFSGGSGDRTSRSRMDEDAARILRRKKLIEEEEALDEGRRRYATPYTGPSTPRSREVIGRDVDQVIDGEDRERKLNESLASSPYRQEARIRTKVANQTGDDEPTGLDAFLARGRAIQQLEREDLERSRNAEMARGLLENEDPMARAIFGATAGTAATLGSAVSSFVDEDTADALLAGKEGFQQEVQRQREEQDENPEFTRMFQSGVESLQIALPVGGVGGPYAAAAAFGYNSYNEGLYQAEQAGLTGNDRLRFATEQGLAEGLTTAIFNKIGLGGLESRAAGRVMMDGVRKGAGKRVLKDLGAEETEELIVTTLQTISEDLEGVNPDALSELPKRLVDTALTTGLMMGQVETTQFLANPSRTNFNALPELAKSLLRKKVTSQSEREELSKEISKYAPLTPPIAPPFGTPARGFEPPLPDGVAGQRQFNEVLTDEVRTGQPVDQSRVDLMSEGVIDEAAQQQEAEKQQIYTEFYSSPQTAAQFAAENPEAAEKLAGQNRYTMKVFGGADPNLPPSTDTAARRQFLDNVKLALDPELGLAAQEGVSDQIRTDGQWHEINPQIEIPPEIDQEVRGDRKFVRFGQATKPEQRQPEQEQQDEGSSRPDDAREQPASSGLEQITQQITQLPDVQLTAFRDELATDESETAQEILAAVEQEIANRGPSQQAEPEPEQEQEQVQPETRRNPEDIPNEELDATINAQPESAVSLPAGPDVAAPESENAPASDVLPEGVIPEEAIPQESVPGQPATLESLPDEAQQGFEQNVLAPLREQVAELDDVRNKMGSRYSWEVSTKNGIRPGDPHKGSEALQRWKEQAAEFGIDPRIADSNPELNDLQTRLEAHRGWGDEVTAGPPDSQTAPEPVSVPEETIVPAAEPAGRPLEQQQLALEAEADTEPDPTVKKFPKKRKRRPQPFRLPKLEPKIPSAFEGVDADVQAAFDSPDNELEGVDQVNLQGFFNEDYDSNVEEWKRTETLRAAARKATGLNSGKMRLIENQGGRDHSSVDGFDTAARSFIAENDTGLPDGPEGAQALWEFIREGIQPAPIRKDSIDAAVMRANNELDDSFDMANAEMAEPDEFELQREPAKRVVPPTFEGSDQNTQKPLFTGANDEPGQKYMFDTGAEPGLLGRPKPTDPKLTGSDMANADPGMFRIGATKKLGQKGISKASINQTFPGAKVTAAKRGWHVEIGDSFVTVDVVDNIEVDFDAMEAASGQSISPDMRGQIGAAGSFSIELDDGTRHSGLGIIRLSEGMADDATLRHEALHLARRSGMLGDAEWQALVDAHAPDSKNESMQEERIALARETTPDVAPVWDRIKSLFRRVLSRVGIQDYEARDIHNLMDSSGFWGRQAMRSDSRARYQLRGRPDLANPATDPDARELVTRVDEQRNQNGQPEVLSDTDVQAEADARLAADFDGERHKLLQAGRNGTQLNPAETVMAKSMVNREAANAMQSGDQARVSDAMALIESYRNTGTEQARSFRLRQDPVESPAERMGRALSEAILTPPESQRKRRNKLRRDGNNEAADKINEDWAKQFEGLKKRLKDLGINIDDLNEGGYSRIKAAKALHTISQAKGGFADRMYEYWRNAILSAPTTQAANLIGNFGHAAWHNTAERFTEIGVNSVMGMPEGAQAGELTHVLGGIFPGVSRGARNFLTTWNSEQPTFEAQIGREGKHRIEDANTEIMGPLGRAVRIPQRLLLAVDDFSKSVFTEMEVGARAYRMAKAEGLSGDEMRVRIAELQSDITSSAWDEAYDNSLDLTFQEEGLQVTQNVKTLALKAREDIPGIRYLLPFIVTPTNILATGIKKSPLGMVRIAHKMYDNYKDGKNVMEGLSPNVAQQVLAWAAVLALLDNDPDDPWITGAESELDSTSRQVSYRTHPSQSVRIGGKWYSYSRLEPFATSLGLTVDWVNGIRSGEPKKQLSAVPKSLVSQMKNKTFLSGIGDLMKAVEGESGSFAAKWASSFTTSWVPNVVRSAGRESDDTYMNRSVWGDGNEWWKRLGMRTLQKTELDWTEEFPIYDVWGRPAMRSESPVGSDWLYRITIPLKVRDDDIFVADRLVMNWNNEHPEDEAFPLLPGKSYTEDGETKYMTDSQYADFVKISGTAAREGLSLTELDADNPTKPAINWIGDIIGKARAATKDLLKKKWSGEDVDLDPKDIGREAVKARLMSLAYGATGDPQQGQGTRKQDMEIESLREISSYKEAEQGLKDKWLSFAQSRENEVAEKFKRPPREVETFNHTPAYYQRLNRLREIWKK